MLPRTIKHPRKFLQSPAAGYDGVFDWGWMMGCFGETRIMPMDIDCIIERKGHFLVVETKDPGVDVPDGQFYTLKALHETGHFTILIVWGKTKPEDAEIWYPRSDAVKTVHGAAGIKEIVARWFAWADRK